MANSDGRGYSAPGKLARLPALDGLRGIGLPLVLLYHHGLPLFGARFGGGILTVSMFFTLSGFLITRLLLGEANRSGTISLKRFYSRRFRRLMPTALAVFALIALFWAVFPSPTRGLSAASFFWAVFYGTNLHLIAQGSSYENLFAERSPLQHTWSLSLEEQIYIVFPLLLLLILRSSRVRRFAAPVLAVLALASFAMSVYWTSVGGNTRAYYATEARAGEFLLGAAMAAFWLSSPLVPRLSSWIRSSPGRIAGLALLAANFILWLSVGLENDYLFRGATLLNAIMACVLMAYSSADPHRGASALLSHPWLVQIGQRAYTLYLVHWPVFVFLDRENVGLASLALFIVRVAVTALIAETLYRLFENPILTSAMWPGRRLVRGCALLGATGLAIAAFAPTPVVGALIDTEAIKLQQDALAALPQIGPNDPVTSSIDPTLPARVLVVGDSQSWFVGTGMEQMWGDVNGVDVQPSSGVGCGVAPITPIRYLGEEFPLGRPGCREWLGALGPIVQRFQPQVVVIVGGLGDLSDRQVDGRWQHIGEPGYDAWLRTSMASFAAQFSDAGSRVLWMTHPHVDPPNPPEIERFAEEDPARMDRYNQLIAELAAASPHIDSADLASFVINRPGGEFGSTFRPDGSHMLLTEAPDVVAFVAEAIRSSHGAGS